MPKIQMTFEVDASQAGLLAALYVATIQDAEQWADCDEEALEAIEAIFAALGINLPMYQSHVERLRRIIHQINIAIDAELEDNPPEDD